MRQFVTLVAFLIGLFSVFACATAQAPTKSNRLPAQTIAYERPTSGLVEPKSFVVPDVDDWESWWHCSHIPPSPQMQDDVRLVTLLAIITIASVTIEARIPTTRGVVNAMISNQGEIVRRLSKFPGQIYLRPPLLRHLTPEEKGVRPRDSMVGMYEPGYPFVVEPTPIEGRNAAPFLVVVHPQGLGVFCLKESLYGDQVAQY